MIQLTIREIISIQNLNVRYFVIWVAEQIQILVGCYMAEIYCRYGVQIKSWSNVCEMRME